MKNDAAIRRQLGPHSVLTKGGLDLCPRYGPLAYHREKLLLPDNVIELHRAGRVAVFSLDGADQVSVYHDWVPLDAGERQLLPGAVELDDVVGEEHLYAMVCERAVPRAQVEAAIRKDRVRPELPADCSVDHHIVRKEPR